MIGFTMLQMLSILLVFFPLSVVVLYLAAITSLGVEKHCLGVEKHFLGVEKRSLAVKKNHLEGHMQRAQQLDSLNDLLKSTTNDLRIALQEKELGEKALEAARRKEEKARDALGGEKIKYLILTRKYETCMQDLRDASSGSQGTAEKAETDPEVVQSRGKDHQEVASDPETTECARSVDAAALDECHRELKAEKEGREKDAQAHKAERAVLESVLEDTKTKLSSEAKERKTAVLKSSQAQKKIQMMEAAIAELEKTNQALRSEIDVHQKDVEIHKTTVSTLRSSLFDAKKEVEASKLRYLSAESSFNKAQKEISALTNSAISRDSRQSALEAMVQQLQSDAMAQTASRAQLQSELDDVKDKLEREKSMRAADQTFANASYQEAADFAEGILSKNVKLEKDLDDEKKAHAETKKLHADAMVNWITSAPLTDQEIATPISETAIESMMVDLDDEIGIVDSETMTVEPDLPASSSSMTAMDVDCESEIFDFNAYVDGSTLPHHS